MFRPSREYAPLTARFPADIPHKRGKFAATIKLTHYPMATWLGFPHSLAAHLSGMIPQRRQHSLSVAGFSFCLTAGAVRRRPTYS
jgi:hypothetical protein